MKEKILEIIKQEFEKAYVRKFTCVNGFGYSQFERNLADKIFELFNPITMKTDLQNFCIKKDEADPLWPEFKEWINEQAETTLAFTADYYGMKNGYVLCWYKKETRSKEITLTQWYEAVRGKWEPMVGDRCEFSDKGELWTKREVYFAGYHPFNREYKYLSASKEHNNVEVWKHIRPIKPSLRDKIIEALKIFDYHCSATRDKGRENTADRIIQLMKEDQS